MEKKHYILIEGGIGLGKTRWQRLWARSLGAKVLFEPAEGVKPVSRDYYKDPAALRV